MRIVSPRQLVLAVVAAAFAGSGCATPESESPELYARCAQLYALWARTESGIALHTTRKRAEISLLKCQRGQYDAGIQELEQQLRQNRIAIPPMQDAQRS